MTRRGHHNQAWRRRGFLLRPWHVIAIEALKGGVGKSWLAANLASEDARRTGRPVLIIELDPQGTLTNMITGLSPEALPHTVGTVIRDVIQGADPVTTAWNALIRLDDPRLPIPDEQRAAWGPIWILPCNLDCGGLLVPQNQLRILDRIITGLMGTGSIHRAWLDFSPSVSSLSMAGRYAMRRTVGVTEPAKGAVRSVRQWVDTLAKIKPHHPELTPAGVVVNKHIAHETEHGFRVEELQSTLRALREAYGTGPDGLRPELLTPLLPRRAVVQRAEGEELPLRAYGSEGREVGDLLSQLHTKITKEHS